MIRLSWLDLETTGTDPVKDDILEIGSIITDADFNELGCYQTLVKPEKTKLQDQTFAAHLTSGLYEEAMRVGASRGGAIFELGSFFRRWLAYDDTIFLAGNNPHFDQGFLPADLFRRFSYRHLNVSVFKVLAEMGLVDKVEPLDGEKHRVMADLRHSIAHLRLIRNRYFRSVSPEKPESKKTGYDSTRAEYEAMANAYHRGTPPPRCSYCGSYALTVVDANFALCGECQRRREAIFDIPEKPR